MKREKIVSMALTNDEHKDIMTYIATQLIDNDTVVRKSELMREAIFKFIRNGNSSSSIDTPVDDEQADEQHEQYPDKPALSDPTAFNFDDLNLD